MPDILADAKEWIRINNGEDTEDHLDIETMLRGLVEEVEILREIADHYHWCQPCGDGPDCDVMVAMKATHTRVAGGG